MTQNASDVEIANQGFAAFRQDLNDVLEDITTLHSGTAAPSTTYANQWWYETDTDKLYIRNEDNDAWIEILTLDQANDHLATLGASITLDGTGNVSIDSGDFTVDTSTLHVDSTNNRVGVGVASPAQKMTVNGGNMQLTGSTYTDFSDYWGTGDNRAFFAPQGYLGSNGDFAVSLYCNGYRNSGGSFTYMGINSNTSTASGLDLLPTGEIRFRGGTASGTVLPQRMTIDSSGNVLVGTTDTLPASNNDANGFALRADGNFQASRSGAACARLNRGTSDGEIVSFHEDGTQVGAIGIESGGGVYFSSAPNNVGIRVWTGGAILPSNADGSNKDNNLDLGHPSVRWDDVYATNGTIQTSDQNEKQQIASLTDAEITAAKAISKLFKTFKWNDSVEAKGDAARTHTGVIAQDVQQAMTDAGLDAGDYAFFISTTWWETQTEVPAVEAVEAQDAVYDEDGNLVTEAVEAVEAKDAYTRTDTYETAEEAPEGATERTRLGIRYPELLSFIGAATEQRLADIETRLTALEAE